MQNNQLQSDMATLHWMTSQTCGSMAAHTRSAFKLRLHCSRARNCNRNFWDGSCARRCCHTALQFVCARGLYRSTPWVRCCNAYLVVARPCVAGVPMQRVCGGLAIVTQSNALCTLTSHLTPPRHSIRTERNDSQWTRRGYRGNVCVVC